MTIKEMKLKGVFEIQFESRQDERGFFMRTYDDQVFADKGINRKWVQENHSLSLKKGTIRGLHFQRPPHAETKLIRVITGELFDAFVDLRKGSPTFGQWDSIILSEENKKAVYIPQGFAQGFCALTDNVNIAYKVDNNYAPEYEGIIQCNDKDIGIQWPVDQQILSEKDSRAGSFKEFIDKYQVLEV